MQDAAHIMLTYEGEPLSFLSVPGAKDVGVEVHSLSKGFDMIGWRMGWVCGHERIVQAFADVKDNCDSGQFMAIQKAAPRRWTTRRFPQQVRAKYERRCRKLVDMLNRVRLRLPDAGRHVFPLCHSPRGIAGGPNFETAEAASQYLITEHSICTVPWDDAGAYPAVFGHLRSRRRSGRRRTDGRNRNASQADQARCSKVHAHRLTSPPAVSPAPAARRINRCANRPAILRITLARRNWIVRRLKSSRRAMALSGLPVGGQPQHVLLVGRQRLVAIQQVVALGLAPGSRVRRARLRGECSPISAEPR